MPKYQPITRDAFVGLRWQSPTHYRDSEHLGHITLSPREVYRAATVMPVAFARQGKTLEPVAIVGQQADRNLFIGPEGQWLGRYVPAVLRHSPFRLMPTSKGEAALCADIESEWISEADGYAFFDGHQPSEAVQRMLAELTQWQSDCGKPLQAIMEALQENNLLKPWPLTFVQPDGTECVHEGLYHIDQQALEALKGASLEQLHRVHALPLIYAHRLSAFHLQQLNRLAEAHASVAAPPTDLDAMFGEDDELGFDFD